MGVPARGWGAEGCKGEVPLDLSGREQKDQGPRPMPSPQEAGRCSGGWE